MQLGDLLCYTLITIAVTTTCVEAEEKKQKETRLEEIKTKKIIKRDTSLFIDNFPIETSFNKRPKVIYRRVSRQRYNSYPKAKYESHYKPKYGPPPSRKPKRKIPKNYRKKFNYQYGAPTKQRSPKPQYGSPKRPLKKPVHRPPKTAPPVYNTEPAGFAEPPVIKEPQYSPPQQHYAEPPVDSYGAPLKTPKEHYPGPGYDENQIYYGHKDYSNIPQEFPPWQDFQQDTDNALGYSKKRPVFLQPDELADTHVAQDDEGFFSDQIHRYQESQHLYNRKKKPQSFEDSNKILPPKYWKPKFNKKKVKEEVDDEILVGGQYAEPPARYVPKFQPSAPMHTGSDDFTPAIHFGDFYVPSTSATISPYVNYINSNMAFSPQNLNDAFSS